MHSLSVFSPAFQKIRTDNSQTWALLTQSDIRSKIQKERQKRDTDQEHAHKQKTRVSFTNMSSYNQSLSQFNVGIIMNKSKIYHLHLFEIHNKTHYRTFVALKRNLL